MIATHVLRAISIFLEFDVKLDGFTSKIGSSFKAQLTRFKLFTMFQPIETSALKAEILHKPAESLVFSSIIVWKFRT